MTKSLLGRVIRPALLGCGLLLVLAATADTARADFPNPVPEIGPGSLPAALALLAGGLLIYRSRRN